MYGDYEFNDDDEDEDYKANWEQVKRIIIVKKSWTSWRLFAQLDNKSACLYVVCRTV